APNAWDQIFLPWRDRELLAPYLHPGALRRPLQDTTKAGDFGVWLESVSTGYHPPVSLKRSWRDDGSAYVEVQLWGAGDPLDIVKAFEYRMEEPDPKFLSELKRRGIKVYDRRNFRTSNGDYLKESGAFKDLPKN
ncbi:MAG TPA: hypothetical protein DCS07_13645, partial [Bdellovibrionales bacterium]|nr:hypothetical protein [Bdellovibrionales bacterium]